MSSTSKQFNGLIKELKTQGWDVTGCGSGATHYKAVPPDSKKEIVHFSRSSEPRAFKNTIRDLRHSGFIWPPPPKSKPANPFIEDNSEDEAALKRAIEETDAIEDPPSQVAPLSDEARMDQLWERLKEARGYLHLAEEQVKERAEAVAAAQEVLAEAQAKAKQAEGERLKAAQRLQEAKQKLDAAIMPPEPEQAPKTTRGLQAVSVV